MSAFWLHTARFLLLNTFFIAALGCGTTRTPPPSVESRFENPEQIRDDYIFVAEWWKIYDDAALDAIVEHALKNNIDYAKSAVNVDKALYQAGLSKADLLPNVSVKGTESINATLHSGQEAARAFKGEISISSYEVDLWRRISDLSSVQFWEYKATIEDKQAMRLTIINNVIDAYFKLVYLHSAIQVVQNSIINYEKILQTVLAKYRYGKVGGLEVEQARQSIQSAKNSLIKFEIEQKTTMQTFSLLLNSPPDSKFAIKNYDFLLMSFKDVELDVPVAVLAKRPDLKAAEYRLKKSFININATIKQLYPKITLGSALSSSINQSAFPLTTDKVNTFFAFPLFLGTMSLDLPFLRWNSIKWNIKVSEAEYDIAKLEFEDSLTTALNELSVAIFNYNKYKDMYKNSRTKNSHDAAISKYYKLRYDAGSGEISDWLNAMNTALESELLALDHRYQTLKYETMVYKTMTGRFKKLARQ